MAACSLQDVDVLVINEGASLVQIEAVAEDYAAVLREYWIVETTNAIVRLFMTLFIPLATLGLFAFAGNKLWNAIAHMD